MFYVSDEKGCLIRWVRVVLVTFALFGIATDSANWYDYLILTEAAINLLFTVVIWLIKRRRERAELERMEQENLERKLSAQKRAKAQEEGNETAP